MVSPGSESSHHSESSLQWSGLETEGMKYVKCSLLLPNNVKLRARIKSLPRSSMVVHGDGAWDSSSSKNDGKEEERVQFGGMTIMQLEPSRSFVQMPVTMTVAGRCHFTSQDYKSFLMLMRTKNQSEQMKIKPNGLFDWPDVESFLLCPVCQASAEIPKQESKKEYWLLFYPLVQFTVMEGSKMALGTRTICRLACPECMETVLKGKTIKTKRTQGSVVKSSVLSALDVLKVVGSASFLQDNPPRPDSHPNIHDVMGAYTLYTLWEQSGAWEALQHDYREALSRSVTGKEEAESSQIEVSRKSRIGRKCDNPGCKRSHGKYDTSLGILVTLTVPCHICRAVHYCSRQCRAISYNGHRETCLKYQEKSKLLEKEVEEKAANKEENKKQDGNNVRIECSYCKKRRPYTDMKTCSRCKSVAYCTLACQKEGWNFHKVLCIRRK